MVHKNYIRGSGQSPPVQDELKFQVLNLFRRAKPVARPRRAG
jgi:hypothetical protein